MLDPSWLFFLSVQHLTSLTRPNKNMTNTCDSCCTEDGRRQYAPEWNQNHHFCLCELTGSVKWGKKYNKTKKWVIVDGVSTQKNKKKRQQKKELACVTIWISTNYNFRILLLFDCLGKFTQKKVVRMLGSVYVPVIFLSSPSSALESLRTTCSHCMDLRLRFHLILWVT